MSFIDRITPNAEALGELVQGKAEQWLDEYKKAVVVMETLGFTVGKFTIGMGALPEIHTTLTGAVDAIDPAKLEAMKAERQNETLLVSLLKALIMAKRLADRVEFKLQLVTLHITLGFPPKIDVEIH